MQHLLQPLIDKALVTALRLSLSQSGLAIGDTASVTLEPDDQISVHAVLPRKYWFSLRRGPRHLGYLDAKIIPILRPLLQAQDTLRVRIVGLTPEHLAPDGVPELYISVWGHFAHLLPKPAKAKAATGPSRAPAAVPTPTAVPAAVAVSTPAAADKEK